MLRRTENMNVSESEISEAAAVPPGKIKYRVEDRFDKAIAEVEDYAIIFLDTEGRISTWNKGAEKIKGYTQEEIIGKTFKLFYPREDKENNLPDTLLARAARDGRTAHEGWRIRKDGSRFWGSVTITAIHDHNGTITGYLKVTRDLTERKMAEDSFHNYTEALKLKNEELKRSEARYHKMVEEVQDYAIILMDNVGNILDWNKGAERVKGYHPQEIIGKNFRLFYPKEDRDGGLPEKLLHEAITNGCVNHEGWRVRKNGSRFWGNVSITALHADDGEHFGFSKVTRDLTDKKIAEDRLSNMVEELKQRNVMLQQSEEWYHRMIEEVQDYAIIFLDTRGDIQTWNAGAEKIKGYRRDEVIGKNFRMFYTAQDQESGLPEKVLQEAIEHGRTVKEGFRVRKDGTVFWANLVVTALHGKDGRVIGFSKVTRDLSERRDAEEAIASKNRALEQANVELSSFAFIASHDLKEPLRKIQIFTSRIMEQSLSAEKSSDYLGKIMSSAARMQRLIDDLLAFSKLTKPEDKVDVDLNSTIENAIHDLEILINEKKAEIRYNGMPTISGVPFQFQQLFFNLVSNSLKFSKPGVTPLIDISSDIVHGPVEAHGVTISTRYHRIRIADNGIGFDTSQGRKIFDIFYRLHSKESFDGTGIGLAIVKKVVDNYNGFVHAEGKPGEGSVFYLYFPA